MIFLKAICLGRPEEMTVTRDHFPEAYRSLGFGTRTALIVFHSLWLTFVPWLAVESTFCYADGPKFLLM
jgi:hypothetical protein